MELREDRGIPLGLLVRRPEPARRDTNPAAIAPQLSAVASRLAVVDDVLLRDVAACRGGGRAARVAGARAVGHWSSPG
jgi:3-oxoacyl-ACP reductase-like protein